MCVYDRLAYLCVGSGLSVSEVGLKKIWEEITRPQPAIFFAALSKRKMRNRHRERPAGRACCFVTAPCYRWVSCLCSVDVCVHLWLAFVIYRSFTMTSVACGWFFFQRFSLLCDLQKKNCFVGTPTWFTLVDADLVQTEKYRKCSRCWE